MARAAPGHPLRFDVSPTRMKIVFWIFASIGILFVSIVGLFVLLWIRSIRKTVKRDKELDLRVEDVMRSVDEGRTPDQGLLMPLAKDPLTRAHLFGKLAETGKEDLFPDEFRSHEKLAESDLVRWLYHPNELGAVPTETELIFKHDVSEDGRTGTCYLFRFRVDTSHWAAERGWMCGLAGPFWSDEPNQSYGPSTFSEMAPYSDQSIEGHLAFLAHASTRFGWVMPNPLKG
jgi:hypothetical protein